MFNCNFIAYVLCFVSVRAAENTFSCRERSNHFRQDGGLCFEIPPWQHQPVEVERHLDKLRGTWGNSSISRRAVRGPKLALVNSDVSRYMDTVIAPFLDTYHRNIQSSYQQFTAKILQMIKEKIKAAVKYKTNVYTELIELADRLNVPAICDEERRSAKTIASRHVAQVYRCGEEARASTAKMAKYVDQMINITRTHMQTAVAAATSALHNGLRARGQKESIADCLNKLSKAAIALGYELDLSLTNARRHNEQSCERLSSCCSRAADSTQEAVSALRDQLYQCVDA